MDINLFPIKIFKGRIVPSPSEIDETNDLFNDLQEYTDKGVWAGESGKSSGQLTKMLHEKHYEMHWITRQTLKLVVDYWKDINYSTEFDINLETCWVNFHEYGDTTSEHSHADGVNRADISAVYYYSKHPLSGHIQFKNPLEYIHMLTPYAGSYEFSEDCWSTVPTETYDVLIFPSWLKHRTQPNLSQQKRIAVSMNFQMVKYVSV